MPESIRFAATVSYDGREFAGSQRQLHARTVQGELEGAAESLFGAATRVELAGRTDARVHAIGQVAAFSAATALEPGTVERALNAHLPEDVAVRDVREVPAAFDPRRWARRRWYRYSLLTAAVRLPLQRRTTWLTGPQLDLAAMKEAARALLGGRDFSAPAPDRLRKAARRCALSPRPASPRPAVCSPSISRRRPFSRKWSAASSAVSCESDAAPSALPSSRAQSPPPRPPRWALQPRRTASACSVSWYDEGYAT